MRAYPKFILWASTLFVCFLHVSEVRSQETPPKPITVSLYAFAYAPGMKDIHLLDPEGEHYKVGLSTGRILPGLDTVITSVGTVLLKNKVTDDEGLVSYPTIATVKIPSMARKPLVILFPSKGDEKYQSIVIDQQNNNFPKGSFKLINTSRTPVRGMVGDAQIGALPGETKGFEPSGNDNDELQVIFQYRDSEKAWKTFCRTRWVKEDDRRNLLICYLDSDRDRMEIRGLPVKEKYVPAPIPNKNRP